MERRRWFGEHGRFGERHGSRRFGAHVVKLRLEGGFDHGGFRQFVHGEAGEHGPLRQRLLPRPLVCFLDEQPLLAGVLPTFERYQREAPAQLVALQLEQQLAFLDASLEPAREVLKRQIRALIPDHDLPSPVVAGRNGALEIRVLHRMILHLHRKALVLRIHRRPLGHRPGLQHIVHFQPKVPMQPRRRMLLHHEQPPSSGRRPGPTRPKRLRRSRRPTPLTVGFEVGTLGGLACTGVGNH